MPYKIDMSIDGFMEPDELLWLHDQASQFRSVLEIGCWLGRSTSALAQGCPDGRVYTVDHFEGSPSELDAAHAGAAEMDLYNKAVVNLAKYDNVQILKMPSLVASRHFRRESIDMIFIDGEHTELAVLTDLIAWYPKCRKLLCGHDLNWPPVISALAIYGIPFEAGPGHIWYMDLINA